MPTSRCFKEAPLAFRAVMNILGHAVLPVAQYFTDAINTAKTSGRNLVVMSVGEKHIGERGYYLGQKPMASSLESQDEDMQEKIWLACEKWANFEPSETALKR
jgi:WW domain-containing oxidoreductase